MNIVEDILECKCGELHQLDPYGMRACLWIICDCGETYCSNCGSNKVEDRENITETDYLWCNRVCKGCGAVGCGECI